MACISCGTDNPAGAKFCNGCGSKLAAGCPTCGSQNGPGARFCNECGSPLAGGAPPVPAGRTDVDPGHAFYLGYEMAKAGTALTLGKDYRQDQALDWGHLTEPEIGHGPSKAAAAVARAAGAPASPE